MATLIHYRIILEIILLSTGIVSTFFMLKTAISPGYIFDMVLGSTREVVNLFNNFLSSSLYICLFINSVVILIFTFSRLNFLNVFSQISQPSTKPQHQHHEEEEEEEEEYMPKRTNSAIAMDTVMSFFSRYSYPVVSLDDIIQDEIDHHDSEINKQPCSRNPSHDITEYLNTTPSKNQEQQLGNQENTEETEDDDSLEATWKVITGEVNKEKKDKVLKKSETFTWPVAAAEELVSAESIESKDLLPSVAAAWKDLRKSLTFNDSLSTFRRGGLRGDFSVSAEESNKKFDDFIKKINYERMLQRQESDQRALNITG